MGSAGVISALLPVVLLIAAGVAVGRLGWVGASAVRDLSNLVFLVLSPALLFRTMATVRLEQIAFGSLASYFLGAGLVFLATLLLRGFNRRAAVLALAATFSNTLMIGVPLIGLAYGEAGLAQLFPLISVHALVMLTAATVVLELSVLREQQAAGEAASRPVGHTVGLAIRNAVIHPVPLPIMAGLLWGQLGFALPGVVDKPLQLLGQAFGPIALLMVGVTLAQTRVGPLWQQAVGLATLKNFVHPALVLAIGMAMGAQGLPLSVMVLAACLPIGANVYLFAQRYQVAQELVTASVAVSTLLAMLSLSAFLAFFGAA